MALLRWLRAASRRRRTSEVLARRLELALEAGRMAAWVFDRETEHLVWDGRPDELYPPRAPATVSGLLGMVHTEDRERLAAAMRQSPKEAAPFEVVHRLVLADGTARWMELRGEPVRDRKRLVGAAGVVVDVTRSRAAEAELIAHRTALERLLDVGPAITVADDPNEVPRRICEAAAAMFECDACGIWALTEDVVRPVVTHPTDLGTGAGPPIALPDLPLLRGDAPSRSPLFVVAGEVGFPPIENLLRRNDMRCGVVVPMGEHGRDGLYLTLWWCEERPPPDLGEQAFLRRFTDQVALALEQARSRAALDEAAALGSTLQLGLLPAPSVRDERIEVTARYRPSEQRILLGGDFYDVVERADGSIAFVVGDVMGHGPGPAAMGAALRAAWRGLALTGPDPAAWLGGIATTLGSYEAGRDVLVTACTGAIASDGSTVTLVAAGHPHPILLADGDVRTLVPPTAVPLGVEAPGRGFVSMNEPLPPGWRLLLYTDGVIEVRAGRRPGDRLGEDGLTAWLAGRPVGEDADVLLDELVAHLEQLHEGPLDDDLAVVLLERR